MVLPDELHLESLEVGAAPLVRHFLHRLDLHGLFERHLPVLPGRLPALPSATVLCLLVTNFRYPDMGPSSDEGLVSLDGQAKA
jgi:hypothetical protein